MRIIFHVVIVLLICGFFQSFNDQSGRLSFCLSSSGTGGKRLFQRPGRLLYMLRCVIMVWCNMCMCERFRENVVNIFPKSRATFFEIHFCFLVIIIVISKHFFFF